MLTQTDSNMGKKLSATVVNSNIAVSKCISSFVGLAIGDALGATVEFMTANEIKSRYGVHNKIIGGGWLRLPPGKVTDDTSMSLALGQTIIETQRINPYDIAHSFSHWLKSKPVDVGYTIRRGIQHFRSTNNPCSPETDDAAGNGACMRSLPIAIAMLNRYQNEVEKAVSYQNHVTHNNALSDAATCCVIKMIQMAILGKDLGALFDGPVVDLINDYPEFNFHTSAVTNPSGYIVDTIRAVFQSLSTTDSFEACLVDVVNRGGDADTTGAIAGMIAGSIYELNEIPQDWINSLDQKVLQKCEYQATKLYELRPNIHLSETNPLI